MMKLILTITACLLLGAASDVAAAGWRGIVPLHSTSADVERVLGPPARVWMGIYFYEFEKETVKFFFSKGACGTESSGWDVPRDTVVAISVSPKPNRLQFADLRLEESKFKKERDREVGDVYHYINEEEGVTYEVDMSYDDAVTLISYYPAAKDAGLRCPPRRTTAPAGAQAKSKAKGNPRRRGKP
jgi:hypothetical protein